MSLYLSANKNGHQSSGRIGGRFETCRWLLHQRTPTAHRSTAPPSGERAVIVIIAIKAAVHGFSTRPAYALVPEIVNPDSFPSVFIRVRPWPLLNQTSSSA